MLPRTALQHPKKIVVPAGQFAARDFAGPGPCPPAGVLSASSVSAFNCDHWSLPGSLLPHPPGRESCNSCGMSGTVPCWTAVPQ